ncbi:hypothetical protein A2625_02610 [candidate division WOR-1 bacterium RIFCSPHIGHO2_01_FULL_53_15]|uniref:NADH:ubiquinone oxidoreductase intermediate-associated protein 30 domain-containing protein n=1 Tax=candidate division WOR-1 bacterium RIFCSPHIGHO2_01_FULL_53_15 TaxID=1802564 RepID=A0A1F4Q1Q4_UNCSA|nr:MAG: hypothetical protein A2625_02610 [candidate division WOR-1 bacterium RIFCSPHIGHO2_01_FULL_53_15]OGC10668.1 MAG: hypothetical protein A3D23_00610 [candidate division WOR-1 bacterium RIFCSPHIGHO2_02_FULL_53_26]
MGKNKRVFLLWAACFGALLAVSAGAEFSFYLIDNFESGQAGKWYRFGGLETTVERNPSSEADSQDTIAESCGDFALKLKSRAAHWFAGGIGTDIYADASSFSRFQMDIFGSGAGGKIKIEVFDDDNDNYSLEQDPSKNWLATKDDKWVAEVPILGKGFTRVSIPFSALKLENPVSGDGLWNPDHKNGSGGLLKVQFVLLTDRETGEVEAGIDNILLTY